MQVDYAALLLVISGILSAFGAIIVTLYPPTSKKNKIVNIVLFFVFAIISIGSAVVQQIHVSQKEFSQEIREQQFQQQVAYMKGQITSLVTIGSKPPQTNAEALRLGMILQQMEKKLDTTNAELNAPKYKLKEECIKLSKDIYEFLALRSKTEDVTPGNWQQNIDHSRQTYFLFENNFRNRIIALQGQLSLMGIRPNPQHESFVNNPVNPLGMKEVASAFLVMANQVKTDQ